MEQNEGAIFLALKVKEMAQTSLLSQNYPALPLHLNVEASVINFIFFSISGDRETIGFRFPKKRRF